MNFNRLPPANLAGLPGKPSKQQDNRKLNKEVVKMEENKINELEERELTDEESEKVAGGKATPTRLRSSRVRKSKKQAAPQGETPDDGSVSGSGSW